MIPKLSIVSLDMTKLMKSNSPLVASFDLVYIYDTKYNNVFNINMYSIHTFDFLNIYLIVDSS